MRKPLSPLKAVAKKYQQKATYSATSGLYTLMWGEKPKRGRKKKSWFEIENWFVVLNRILKLKIDLDCVLTTQKKKHKSKKIFSRNTPPSYKVLTRLFSESIPALLSLFCGTQDPIPHKHPGKRCSARWR